MSKQLFERNGVTVTRFWGGDRGFMFQVTWGWRENEHVQIADRKQAFVFANFLVGGSNGN